MTATRIAAPQPASGEVCTMDWSPDMHEIAFGVVGGREPGIYAGAVGGPCTRLVDGWGTRPADIAWSSSGQLLGWCTLATSEEAQQVRWIGKTGAPHGRAEGVAFAWLGGHDTLLVLDGEAGQLLRVHPASGKSEPLCEVSTDVDPMYRLAVVPSPAGDRIAFTTRSAGDHATRVMLLEHGADGVRLGQLTWIPGDRVHAFPFWSPKGKSLGLFLVHETQRKSAVVLVRHLEGDGEIVYHHGALDGLAPPLWRAGGKSILLFRAAEGGHELVEIDLASGAVAVVAAHLAPGPMRASSDGRIVVGDRAYATILVPAGSAATIRPHQGTIGGEP
jgi:hypothetical protein